MKKVFIVTNSYKKDELYAFSSYENAKQFAVNVIKNDEKDSDFISAEFNDYIEGESDMFLDTNHSFFDETYKGGTVFWRIMLVLVDDVLS